jgi:hypothetical protein
MKKTYLKLLTWNCRGVLREKYKQLDYYNADLIIIQECENPLTFKNSDYIEWAGEYLWLGNIKHKGLGVFAKNGTKIVMNDWPSDGTKYFIPFKIYGKLNALATWCHRANSPTFGYIGQLWKYIQLNIDLLSTVIICNW